MPAIVWMADFRAGYRENMFGKLERLLEQVGLSGVINNEDLCAVKIHFGEKGGHAFIRPVFIRTIVNEIRALGGKPFLTDSCTLYPGERKEAVSALNCGIENGFAYAVAGAPLIICDGLRGHSSRRVKIDAEILSSTDIGIEILEADNLIAVSHFKCHELTGFGGALKNLAMGCSSREGKLEQHSTIAPIVNAKTCTRCGACLPGCAHEAITIKSDAALIDKQACTGCGRCISLCPTRAIQIQWNEESGQVMRKMAEYALGALQNKQGKKLFINFITQVSPSCDCYGHSDAAIVPDIGILAATDPVALDQACADLVNQAQGLPDTALTSGHEPGGDKFRGVHPNIDWEITLEHSEKIGLGTRTYELKRLEPLGKGW
ncbi:MAG: DUF362 domain-containing protein [Geopsychrobacter sp.]|nr:DUF362 domain-containing protein [Geopsychrobacter sp.]